MKINDSGSIKKPAATSVAATQAGASKGAEKAAVTAAAPDNVRLSSQAKALSSTSSTGVFDARKVEEIKAAIANGTFQVDASKVADGLIDSVKDLMNQKRK